MNYALLSHKVHPCHPMYYVLLLHKVLMDPTHDTQSYVKNTSTIQNNFSLNKMCLVTGNYNELSPLLVHPKGTYTVTHHK